MALRAGDSPELQQREAGKLHIKRSLEGYGPSARSYSPQLYLLRFDCQRFKSFG